MLTKRKTFLRQAGFALAGSCLPFSAIFAKEAARVTSPAALDTYHPVDCTVDLATSLPTSYKYTYNSDVTLSEIKVDSGYYSDGGTAINPYSNDVLYEAEGDLPYDLAVCDVTTASGGNAGGNQCNPYDYDPINSPTYQGQNPFRYKVYYPKADVHDYNARPLPVYIFFHAGGYMECTSYDGGQLKKLCIELSRKGFICFTCEYRRGRILDKNATAIDPRITVQQQFARYRAIQDGCGAIRSIIKKNRFGDAQKFPFVIDETQVL